jgi:acetolactate synthase-1/2/3 large subunit
MLNHRYVSQCVAALMDDDAVLFNEYPFTLEDLNANRSGQYYSHSPAGGLGWAMGASMGYRLMRPDALCIATVGDGTYMFGEPTPTHFVSRARNLPFITVIYNNRRYAAVHRATLSVYPEGDASRLEDPMFATLEPAPDYEKIVEASGGLGIRVERAEELPAALLRARDAVRIEGRQAVINVLTEISYGRTS